MVTTVSTKTTTTRKTITQNQKQNSLRKPLFPSDPDNAPRRFPKTRDVSSRYMSSSSTTPKRSASPLISRLPASTPSPSSIKRSLSVDRRRPSTPRSDCGGEVPNAEKMLIKSTRSLSVSFRGESFSFQVSKAKPAPYPVSGRKSTPERRKATPMPTRVTDHVENSRHPAMEKYLWPGRSQQLNSSMTRSLDFTDTIRSKVKNGSTEIKLSSNSIEIKWPYVKCDPLVASDSESVSSNSTLESCSNSKLVSPVAKTVGLRGPVGPKLLALKKLPIDSPLSSPKEVVGRRGQFSPSRSGTLTRPASPSKPREFPRTSSPGKPRELPRTSSPVRGVSPSRVRNAVGGVQNSRSFSPSVLGFSSEVRRARIGENRIGDMHSLRVLYNRLLQWRFVNARVHAALLVQKSIAEESLYNARVTISRVCESVREKRIELQSLSRTLKLASILQGQMMYLEEFSFLGQDYSCSLSGAIESLRASALRLPVIAGARADVMKVKEAICSAVDVMQAMASSVCLLLPKVDGVNSLVAEVASIMAKESAMLNECKYLLSAATAMQVTESSLRTHIMQVQHHVTPSMTTKV